MTVKTLAIAALASATLISGASAIELNTENADRATVTFAAPAAGSVVLEGRSSDSFGPIVLNTENADRDAVHFQAPVPGSFVLEGRSSDTNGPIILNDENRDRITAYGR